MGCNVCGGLCKGGHVFIDGVVVSVGDAIQWHEDESPRGRYFVEAVANRSISLRPTWNTGIGPYIYSERAFAQLLATGYKLVRAGGPKEPAPETSPALSAYYSEPIETRPTPESLRHASPQRTLQAKD